MAINYDKLLKIFEDKRITSYTIKKEKIIGQSTWKKIHENGHIDTHTIEALCKYLNCQPGDIMEYTSDETETEQDTEWNYKKNNPIYNDAGLFLNKLKRYKALITQ